MFLLVFYIVDGSVEVVYVWVFIEFDVDLSFVVVWDDGDLWLVGIYFECGSYFFYEFFFFLEIVLVDVFWGVYDEYDVWFLSILFWCRKINRY